MELNELYENLCVRDKKSPYYDPDYPDDTPRKGCYCDNCFSGKDKLALEIIRLQESLEEYKDTSKYAVYELSKLLQKYKDRIALSWDHGTLQIDDVVHAPDEDGILIYVDCIYNCADLTS